MFETRTYYDEDLNVHVTETMDPEGRLHNNEEGHPALTHRVDNQIVKQGWYKHGKLHRDHDQPALIENNGNGTLIGEYWYQDDQLHRDGDQPAIKKYSRDADLKGFTIISAEMCIERAINPPENMCWTTNILSKSG